MEANKHVIKIDHFINFNGLDHNQAKLYYSIKLDTNVIHVLK